MSNYKPNGKFRHIDAEILAIIDKVIPLPQTKIKPSNYEGFYLIEFAKDYQFDFISRGISDCNRLSGLNINTLKKLKLDELPPSDDFRHSKGTLLKTGKFLKALFGTDNSLDFAKLARELTSQLVILDKNLLHIFDDVSIFYDYEHFIDRPHSCMVGKPTIFFQIYKDLKCKGIAIIKDNKLLARAILWSNLTAIKENGEIIKENVKFLDRIYFVEGLYRDMLIDYAKSINAYYKIKSTIYKPNGNIYKHEFLVKLPDYVKPGYYEATPYLDTLFRVLKKDNAYYLASHLISGFDGLGLLDSTKGNSILSVGNSYFCYLCGEHIPEDELIYVDSIDDYICHDCYTERGIICEYCNEISIIDDNEEYVAIEENGHYHYFCNEDCANGAYYYKCFICQEYHYIENLHYLDHFDEYVCHDCSDAISCQRCDKITNNQVCILTPDKDYNNIIVNFYCENCFINFEEDDRKEFVKLVNGVYMEKEAFFEFLRRNYNKIHDHIESRCRFYLTNYREANQLMLYIISFLDIILERKKLDYQERYLFNHLSYINERILTSSLLHNELFIKFCFNFRFSSYGIMEFEEYFKQIED